MRRVCSRSEADHPVQARFSLTPLDFQSDVVVARMSSTEAPLVPTAPLARGGLPPRILRHVREYIEANLEKKVCLDELASLADLSKHHFVRAFKQSTGLPPHAYLLRRRVDRACELLADTKMPLAEIALAAGFSDQSHFAHRFREQVGITPSLYRWSLR